MDANQLKQELTEAQYIRLLTDLGADPQVKGNNIFCKTICHGGHKHKLAMYTDSKSFRCYTSSCGSMDIFGLVGKVMNLDFFGSFKYVCMKFGISYRGNHKEETGVDVSFFQKFKEQVAEPKIKTISEKILNSYYDYYHESWLEDGISVNSMAKFNIKYSIADNQIVIPHYNEDGELIGSELGT